MNYRQWKKNYKKIHGYNPPIEVDKRKQAKMVKKSLPEMTDSLTNMMKDITNILVPAILSLERRIFNAFSEVFYNASVYCEETADSLNDSEIAYIERGARKEVENGDNR